MDASLCIDTGTCQGLFSRYQQCQTYSCKQMPKTCSKYGLFHRFDQLYIDYVQQQYVAKRHVCIGLKCQWVNNWIIMYYLIVIVLICIIYVVWVVVVVVVVVAGSRRHSCRREGGVQGQPSRCRTTRLPRPLRLNDAVSSFTPHRHKLLPQ